MTLKDWWIAQCLERAMAPADFYSGARKIHTGVMLERVGGLDDSLQVADCGFTNTKISMLRRLYWSDEHAEGVAELWRGRLKRGKYGSVSASTYHHLTKSDPAKRSKRASVMGPCLTGIALTLLDKRSIAVDAFYRTTELFKKFPADLIFIRDVALPALGVDPSKIVRARFHVANCTSHPMYGLTWLALVDDPVQSFELIRAADELKFWPWLVKWSARFICPEYHRGIAKFAQALRVKKDAMERITGDRLAALREYVRDNHPGFRGEEEDEDDDE